MLSFKQYLAEEIVDIKSIDFKSLYDQYNKEFFEGLLPEIPIEIKTLSRSTGLATASYNKKTNEMSNCKITMSNKFKQTLKQYVDVLIHEMIHVWNFVNARWKDGHGVYFTRKMREINQHGFDITLKDEVVKEIGIENKKEFGVLLVDKTATAPQSRRYVLVLFNKKNQESFVKETLRRYSNTKCYIDLIYSSDNELLHFPVPRTKAQFVLINENLYVKLLDDVKSIQHWNFADGIDSEEEAA